MDGGPILHGKRLQPVADAIGEVRRGAQVVLRYGRHEDARWTVRMLGFAHDRELKRRPKSLDAARWVFDHVSGGKLIVRLARAR